MTEVLIKGGRIVTAVDDYTADIFIKDGIIATIGKALEIPNAQQYNASGLLVLPGGIDVHTHMEGM